MIAKTKIIAVLVAMTVLLVGGLTAPSAVAQTAQRGSASGSVSGGSTGTYDPKTGLKPPFDTNPWKPVCASSWTWCLPTAPSAPQSFYTAWRSKAMSDAKSQMPWIMNSFEKNGLLKFDKPPTVMPEWDGTVLSMDNATATLAVVVYLNFTGVTVLDQYKVAVTLQPISHLVLVYQVVRASDDSDLLPTTGTLTNKTANLFRDASTAGAPLTDVFTVQDALPPVTEQISVKLPFPSFSSGLVVCAGLTGINYSLGQAMVGMTAAHALYYYTHAKKKPQEVRLWLKFELTIMFIGTWIVIVATNAGCMATKPV
ncbi:MAG: hypothetical protein V4479_16025 [Actinomycetota bacterium]